MRIAAFPPLLLLMACTSQGREPVNLIPNPHYQALGGPPGWELAIGADQIALRLGHDHFNDEEVAFVIYRFPRVLPREVDGVRRWDWGNISIESRPGPCEHGNGARFADNVVVRFDSRELIGCGGPLVSRSNN